MSNRNTFYGRGDYVSLYHYNPFHDKLGRFASASGGGIRRNRTAENLAKGKTVRRSVYDMSTEEIQADNKRQKAVRQYESNHRDTRLETARLATNEASNAVNRLRNSNREAMAQEQRNRPRMDLSHMSDQQLRERINRENLERQYNQLFNDKPAISKGRQRVDAVLGAAGDVLQVAGTAVGLAVLIQTYKNGRNK